MNAAFSTSYQPSGWLMTHAAICLQPESGKLRERGMPG